MLMVGNLTDSPEQVKAKWPLDGEPFGRFSSPMAKSFGSAVLEAMEARGWTVAELVRQSGVSYDVINKFKYRPNASTSAENARRLSAALSLDWSFDLPDRDDAPDLVPIYDVTVSAGHGMVPAEGEAIIDHMALPPGYLRHITSTPVGKLAIVTVRGDSMAPTLHDKDVVMIDTTKRNLGYDGLFVLRMDGALHVKRVSRGSRNGVVRILSDNRDAYPPTERDLSEIDAVGKVLWYGRKE